VGCRHCSLRQIRPLRHTIKHSLFIGQAVNHRLSTTACQPPLKCQPVYWLTETSSRQTPSSATESLIFGIPFLLCLKKARLAKSAGPDLPESCSHWVPTIAPSKSIRTTSPFFVLYSRIGSSRALNIMTASLPILNGSATALPPVIWSVWVVEDSVRIYAAALRRPTVCVRASKERPLPTARIRSRTTRPSCCCSAHGGYAPRCLSHSRARHARECHRS
jgi:hypothetical protein